MLISVLSNKAVLDLTQAYVDLNDEHVFKFFKLSELLNHNTGESKLVFFAPHYLLQVTKRQHLINLLDMAISVRNVSFFILVLFYLRRASVHLAFEEKANRGETTKITGPWIEAIRYVLKKGSTGGEGHYDAIFARQFFDLTKV